MYYECVFKVQLLKNALDGNKQKIMTLENALLLTTKQLDEERARQKDMKRKILEVNEQKTKSEDELKKQIKEKEDDMRDLKVKIVSLTRCVDIRRN
jgi:septal ring factor EnvC (AmiA/AmiB activator)